MSTPTARVGAPVAGAHPPAVVSGSTINGFDVLAELGCGAHSRVFRVRRAGSTEPAPQYALKIIDGVRSGSPQVQVEFRREAAMLAGVGHPDLPVIHEVGEADGRPYLVMDLVDGVTLARLLIDGALAPDRVLALALEVLGPLSAMHRAGMVHRDLKPDNIMVLPDGGSRLIDFGLAVRDAHELLDTVVGTLAYLAPEQAGTLKRPVDRRSDLYSFGVVLFECLVGRLPFAATEVGELLRMHAVAPAPDLRELVPGIPDGLAAAVARLLAKDPDDRYGSGEELAAHLRQIAGPRAGGSATETGSRTAGDGRPPLRGRAREAAEVASRSAAVRAGAGQVRVIRGPSGIGKTRLAEEFMDQVREQGWLVMRGKCAVDDAMPLAPLRTAVDEYLASIDARPAGERDRLCEQVVRAAGPNGGLLAALTPALGGLLGLSTGHDEAVGPDRFTFAVVDFLLGLARESAGLLLVLDDVQWLDPGTELVLAELTPLLGGAPLLVLATAHEADAVAGARPGVWSVAAEEDLVLGPLADSAVIELVDDLMPGLGAAAAVTSLLCVRGGGNPLVVQEYLRAIVDGGLLRPSWGAWELDGAGLDDLALPQDALGLVVNRVQRLRPQVRAVLVVAAAVGSRFSPRVVGAAHGVGLDDVLAAVGEAAGHLLVEPRENGEFAFLHDRIREVLHDELGVAEAARLHQRIAEALYAEPVPAAGRRPEHVYAVAHHYLAGEPDANPEHAFAAYWAAGRLALENCAPADAVRFLQHAAAAAPHADSEFLLMFGEALIQNGQYAQALERLGQALSGETDPLMRAHMLTRTADAHRSAWEMDAAFAAARRGLAELGARLPHHRVLLVLSTVGMFAVAQVMQLTRWRFGSARGDRLRRAILAAGLHDVCMDAASRGFAPAPLLLHTLRMSYWANRVGAGLPYIRSQVWLAFLYGHLGWTRGQVRNFGRANAEPAGHEPGVQAMTAWQEGLARYFAYQDDGQSLAAAMEQGGRLLDAAAFLDAAALLLADAAAHGLTGEGQRWLALGQARLALSGNEAVSPGVSIVAPMVPALMGHAREAADAVHRARDLVPGGPPLGITVLWHLSRLTGLREQGETGEPFTEAVAEFEALGLTPQELDRPLRVILFVIAMSRLAHCRAGDGQDEQARLALARAAVANLGKGCKGDEQRVRERIARADLLVLEGNPRRALAVLDGIVPVRYPDTPLLAYEAARVRARALLARGSRYEAARQAQLAAVIAQDNGWPHRARWVDAEFGASGESRAFSYGHLASTGPVAALATFGRQTSTGLSASAGMDRQRLAALEQVGAAASRVVDPGALARIALDETVRILAAERAFLFLVDDAGDLVPHLGRDAAGQDVPELTGYSASLVQRVRQSREPVAVTGTEEGAALGAESVVLHGLRSILVAPLQLEGRLLGVVYLDSRVAKGIFTAEDAGILTALTNHIATSLETARAAQLEISVQTAQRQRDLADVLRQALESMTGTVEPQQVLARLLSWSVTLTGCDQAWALTGGVQDCSLTGSAPDGELTIESVRPEQAVSELLGLTQPTVGTAALVPSVLAARLAGAASWIALPLGGTETGFGALILASRRAGAGLADQLEVAAALAVQGMTAYDNARLFARVQELSVIDELTGLANRRRFFEVADRDVAAAHRGRRTLVAMMLDIDHFKRINDTYGHPTGDDVIAEVARRLAGTVRQTDVVGRYGGEEFAVALPDVMADSDLPERLRACVAGTAVQTRSGPLQVTVSIGVAHLLDADADAAAVLARADQALYTAKREGRNCVRTA